MEATNLQWINNQDAFEFEFQKIQNNRSAIRLIDLGYENELDLK